MAKLSNSETGRGFTHVSRIDLEQFRTISGNASQVVTLFAGDNARLESASILCPNNLTSSTDTIRAILGDSSDTDAFIKSTAISGLGSDAGVVAVADIDGVFAPSVGDYDRILGNPGLVIDTNFDVKAANAFDVVVGGYMYTVAANAAFDTGTSEEITADKWGSGLCSVDADGTTYVDWGASYDSEAEAISFAESAARAGATGDVAVGYITVLTGSGATWTAGTDALEGGTGGTPSDDTNYYNYSVTESAIVSEVSGLIDGLAAVTNGKAITTRVDLTLTLSGGNWSANNGAEFYVLMNIATPIDLV